MGSEQNIKACPLRNCALEKPDHILLQDGERACSAVLLDTWVEQYREAMVLQGLVSDDRLVVITLEPLDTVITMIACWRSGIVFCPVNPVFPTRRIQEYCSSINAQWVCQVPETTLEEWHTFFHLRLPQRAITPNSVTDSIAINTEKMGDLIATSGTTGLPKAVAHSYSNHYYSAIGAQDILPLTTEDAWLLSLPLFHVGGMAIVFRCLLARARMVVYDKNTGLLKHLVQTKVTHISLVNTQLYRLLELEKAHLGQIGVKYILLGGGIASPALVEKAQQQGLRVMTTYGMTEMSSQVCTGVPDFTQASVTSGALLKHRQLKLREDGEILVKGKTLALGYFKDGRLQKLTDQQGWYHTGDKGYWHGPDLLIKGRSDNMIISGGENIYPEEIEQALMGVPEIIQAVVVGVSSREFGIRPVAYVQTASGVLDELFTKQQLAGRIAGFKIPDTITLFPDADIYSGIKVNRQLFQQLADKQFMQHTASID